MENYVVILLAYHTKIIKGVEN